MTFPTHKTPLPSAGPFTATRAALCRTWLDMETLIERHLGKTLSMQPYRTFLLELYLAESENGPLFQSCFAAGEAPANAHRRAARLADLGALIREADVQDHRRTGLRLAPRVRLALNRIMDGAMAFCSSLEDTGRSVISPPEDGANLAAMPTARDAGGMADGGGVHRARLAAGSRITLPPNFCRALELRQGDSVLMKLQNGELRIRAAHQALDVMQ